jgi:hypothetical protein
VASEGFEVVDSELRDFAKALGGTADKLAASAGAVRGVSYGVTTWGITFGQICRAFAEKATSNAAAKLDEAAARVRDASTGVTNTAQLYEDVDTFLAENPFGGKDK